MAMGTPDIDYTTKRRLLQLLFLLLEQPRRYTRRELAERLGVHPDTIKNDLLEFNNFGLVVRYDDRYRYFLQHDNRLRQLKDLLHFTEEDQLLLHQAIDQISAGTRRAIQLKQKLNALYDFQQLGHYYLRPEYLRKLDALLQAEKEQKQVVLKKYRSSNSRTIGDRRIEPFHICPPDDCVQAYDLMSGKVRIFRISRAHRVELTDEKWQFKNQHVILYSDPFGIVDLQTCPVRLVVNVTGYNVLSEFWPRTINYLKPTDRQGQYELKCEVNHQFKHLLGFITGFPEGIEAVLEPPALLAAIENEIELLRKKFSTNQGGGEVTTPATPPTWPQNHKKS